MSSPATKQYTIRNIPRSVDRALKKKALEKGKSLNALLLETLSKEAGLEGDPQIHHDLDFLIGTWVHDDETEKALSEQRSVDPKDWK